MIFPISFSIPDCKISQKVSLKTNLVSSLIPGKKSTYIYKNEKDYYDAYKSCYFAHTKKKGGWDCLRHYEIMGCATIPIFEQIEDCPKNTIHRLDRTLLKECNTLWNKYKSYKFQDLLSNDKEELYNCCKKVLEYTKKQLSCRSIAKYVLSSIGMPHVKRVLYISDNPIKPDYLRCLTLIGFKDLFQNNVHDFPEIPHIYKNKNINYSKLYGMGITYSQIYDQDFRDQNLDKNVHEDIAERKYDLIIYGKMNYKDYKENPYLYTEVMGFYKPSEVVFLWGDDIRYQHDPSYWSNKGHPIFVRELE